MFEKTGVLEGKELLWPQPELRETTCIKSLRWENITDSAGERKNHRVIPQNVYSLLTFMK